MKKFARRTGKIAQGQYSDSLCCKGVTKMEGRDNKQSLRTFKKAKRQQLKRQVAAYDTYRS